MTSIRSCQQFYVVSADRHEKQNKKDVSRPVHVLAVSRIPCVCNLGTRRLT